MTASSNLSILLLLITATISANAADTDGHDAGAIVTVKLFHSIGHHNRWTPRGSVLIARDSLQLISRQSAANAVDFNADLLNELQNAAQTDGEYYLKGVSGDRAAQTFIRACSLYTSGLSDLIDITLDTNGNFLGLSLTTSNPYCQVPDETIVSSGKKLTSFNSTINVVQTQIAPGPEVSTYIQRLEQEKVEKMRSPESNKSFFGKYWMYIVPIVIFLLVSSATNPEAGAQGGR